MKKLVAGAVCLLTTVIVVEAQSIYSFEGLGNLEHQGMPNNFGMGEVGIGTPTIWHLNTQNPANLVFNTFSTFQLGLELDNRNFTGENVSGSDTNGALRFLAYAFPVMRGKWSSSFGILPYSTVKYNTFSTTPVDNTSGDIFQESNNRGEGGLTHFYWAHGLRLTGQLSIGVRANYTFGSIEKFSRKVIFEENVDDETNITQRFLIGNVIESRQQESHSDLNLQFGLSYRHEFTDRKFLNLGAIYSPRSELNGSSSISLVRLLPNREVENPVSNSSINRDLPHSFGLGASYQVLNVITIGLDFETQQWKNVAQSGDSFTNFSKIALGVDFVPDYDDVNSYFQRARYAFGINRTRLPYKVNNQTLTDFGINFGASFPVSGFSSLDLAFKIGRLGEAGNGLIRENYFKVVLGATINDTWFIKRRYD